MYRKFLKAGGATIMFAVMLSSCMLAPDYQRPASPIGDQWQSDSMPVPDNASQELPTWETFTNDDYLRDLIRLALANNPNLQLAIMNVEEARLTYGIQRSAILPDLNVGISQLRQGSPENLNPGFLPAVQEQFEVGLGMSSFELDLFGRVRSLSDAALHQYLATAEASNSVRVTLISDVIRSYLLYNGAKKQLELSTETLDSRNTSLTLINQRLSAGAASQLEYQDALSLVQQARLAVARRARAVESARNALDLLTGDTDINRWLPANAADVSQIVQNLSPGAPSSLLTRRPDIRAAERSLIARNAVIGAARAAFLPNISLTAGVGSASQELSELFDSGQSAWTFNPVISVPIFNAGRNYRNLELAELRKEKAVVEYEQAIRSAFVDVANALASAHTLQEEKHALQELTRSSAETLRLAQLRFDSGLDSQLRFLDAKRQDLASNLELLDVSVQHQLALVDLFSALGGGWYDAP